MALLHEFFSSKRKVSGESESRDSARSYKITKEQVRLLLFKDCDWRGRKILFDSSTIDQVPIDKNVKNYTKLAGGGCAPCVVEVADGFAYQYKGPAADASTLGEMMFGAVAMNYKGVSLKIHILNNPHRLMCTKVFGVPVVPKLAKERRRSGHAADPAPSAIDVSGASAPLSVPTFRVEEGVSLSFSFERGDSGFYGEHSPNSSVSSTHDYSTMFDDWGRESVHDDMYTYQTPPSGRKLSSCSNGSWQRRMFRNLSTRFDLQSSNLLTVPSQTGSHGADSQACSTNGSSATCDSLSSASSAGSAAGRRTKLGLALLITLADSHHMDMLRYCAEHSPQLEALICRLRMSVMLSGIQRTDGPRFIATLVRATADAHQWLTDLLNGPRLSPMWLNLVSAPAGAPSSQHRLAESLLTDLCAVLHTGDTKHTKFFISTLITHVLTFHLGWVTTVSPYEVTPEVSDPSPLRSPYNALWAQLSDLCGSIGSPPRAARTIVAGKRDKNFVNKLLTVLTYFIRCGDVKRNAYKSEDFAYGPLTDFSVTSVPVIEPKNVRTKCASALKRTNTRGKLSDLDLSSTKGVVNSDSSLRRSATSAILPQVLSIASQMNDNAENQRNLCARIDEPITSCLKRTSTVLHSLVSPELSELPEGLEDAGKEPKSVVFVLGDDDKLIGIKNKSVKGKSVKKSSRAAPVDSPKVEGAKGAAKHEGICDSEDKGRNSESPSRCCGQQSQHSKPIKHSGFKFEFDKYPQIVTNYMKSKNLEILDRHYIGKPGNLKLDNFQFDPMVVPPIQEERCENCYKCQLIESTLQTPTNASELWSDMSNEDQVRENPTLQYAKEEIVAEEAKGELSGQKTFLRKRKKNTVVINLPDPITLGIGDAYDRLKDVEKGERGSLKAQNQEPSVKHLRVVDVGMPSALKPRLEGRESRIGFHCSLLGGLTDHYVPDMILQGTVASPAEWETEVRRDLDLVTHINKSFDTPLQAVAIVADSDQWAVRVLSNGCGGGGGGAGAGGGGGMSALVGAMLDALPHMRRARVPAHQCLSFMESKLREVCVLSKSLADMLLSTDFCDMATLTSSLSIDVNDVPLLLAVASTHTPHLARRYGVSYR